MAWVHLFEPRLLLIIYFEHSALYNYSNADFNTQKLGFSNKWSIYFVLLPMTLLLRQNPKSNSRRLTITDYQNFVASLIITNMFFTEKVKWIMLGRYVRLVHVQKWWLEAKLNLLYYTRYIFVNGLYYQLQFFDSCQLFSMTCQQKLVKIRDNKF